VDKSVYVIGPKDGPFKVGHTISVLRRLTTMQTGSPVRLFVHFQRQAPSGTPAKDIEWRTQQHLKAFHLWGEWFTCPLERVLIEVEAAFLYARMVPNQPLRRVISLEQIKLRDDRRRSGMTRAEWKARTSDEKIAARAAVA